MEVDTMNGRIIHEPWTPFLGGGMPLRGPSIAAALLAQLHHRESVEKVQRCVHKSSNKWALALPSLNYGTSQIV